MVKNVTKDIILNQYSYYFENTLKKNYNFLY